MVFYIFSSSSFSLGMEGCCEISEGSSTTIGFSDPFKYLLQRQGNSETAYRGLPLLSTLIVLCSQVLTPPSSAPRWCNKDVSVVHSVLLKKKKKKSHSSLIYRRTTEFCYLGKQIRNVFGCLSSETSSHERKKILL